MKKIITYIIIVVILIVLGVVLFGRSENKPNFTPIPVMTPVPSETTVPIYPNHDGKE